MTTTPSAKSARLPKIIVPEHYDITYSRIDLVNHTFEGSVALQCLSAVSDLETACLTVHSLELQLIQAKLQIKSAADDSDPRVIQAEEFRYKLKDQTCEIVFAEKNFLQEGARMILTIDFIGVLNDSMRGLYRSTYTGLDRKVHTMATTQFEATDARRAFPCLDEPALKATFSLTVTIPADKQCISNTPMASTYTSYKVDGGNSQPTKTITFQKTPKMSTYLLALVVGEFDGISKTSNQIVTTVYTVPGKAHNASFCLDVAVRCLDLFQELFGVPYPLVKSDLLAIPDFASGAMENWGCITYREHRVLVKPNSTSESTKRRIARTTCHELAHQWFGNLVTMEYWTQLYLKEGVARFMEFVGIDTLFPEWNAWTEFVQSVYGLAMSLDAMKSSHPVEVEVNHPDEIDEIFDAISYAKGASIIRMIASYIGMDTFYRGMRTYLSRHAYGNTVTNDLWRALQESSGVPVVEFMAPWTLEMGYPILLLSDDGSLRVTRFLASGPDDDDGEEKTPHWPIPVTARVQGLDEIQGPWVIHGPNGNDTDELEANLSEWRAASKWFKLNVDQTGFFRVAYSRDQWQKLSQVMNPDGPLSTTDRLGLLSDSFASGKAGYTSIVDSLALVEGFGNHDTAEYTVWEELSENLSSIASLLRSESCFPNFQKFIKRLYSRQMDRLGWDAKRDEPSRTGTLRGTVISMMGIAQDETVLKEAYSRFMAFKENPDGAAIPGDLQRAVFRCALRYDEAVVFEALKSIYEERSMFPEEERNCLSVMGCVKDSQRHSEMLEFVFWSGKVRLQDISFPLNSLSGTTHEGGRSTWRFLQDNYTRLHSRLGSGPMWGNCVGLCCRGLTTSEEADAVENFFLDPSRAPGSAKRRLTQALEVVRTNAIRRERDKESVDGYLRTIIV